MSADYDIDGTSPRGAGPASPSYTKVAHAHERIVSCDSSLPALFDSSFFTDPDSLWSPTHAYCHNDNMLSISLGRHSWGLRHPAFGSRAEVQGAVRLAARCTHVTKLCISLIGKLNVMVSVRGAMSNMFKFRLVDESIILPNPSASASGYYPTDHIYHFSLSFPSTVKVNGDYEPASPPPTFSTWSPGMSCNMSYFVRVDVTRKGLRRHEQRNITVYHLPKTWPIRDMPTGAPLIRDALKTVKLRVSWPENSRIDAATKGSVPSVFVCLPEGSSVSSGHPLPLRVTIHAPVAPALASLLVRGIEVVLTKRTRIRIHGRVTSSREKIISTAITLDVDTAREDYSVVHLSVPTGEVGREQSWSIDGLVEVLYQLHVVVRAPKGTSKFLPEYTHNERVHIATEPWGMRERESLSLGGSSAPALGLYDRRLEHSALQALVR